MEIFIKWIKEGEEHKKAFERCSIMQIGGNYLKGAQTLIRKIRFVRLIRRVIEEGIMVRGVNEIYEDGCRILDEIVGGSREGEEEEEEERYMYELWLLKVRGIEKKLKEDEISVLKRKVEEETRGRETEKKRADEAEARNRELDNKIKELNEEIRKLSGEAAQEEITSTKQKSMPVMKQQTVKYVTQPSSTGIPQVSTSLDVISVKFSVSDESRREGNRIIHDSNSWDQRHCFIGGEMQLVCVC